MTLYPALPSAELARTFRRRLLAWYRRHHRDLPWRNRRDPYAIWVSEVMLQQTQVATVVPYFERFLDRFPTIRALAEAERKDVYLAWQGLGYYRRATNLHEAAQRIITEWDGEFPRDEAYLRRLPGIGRYMAGAILSQAFDARLPIVEANSTRVLCRWFACRHDCRSAAVQRWLWTAAERMLPVKRCGEFNQALMELGALICTPKQPQCDRCPVRRHCAACQLGEQGLVPVQRKSAKAEEVHEIAVVVRRRDRVLLLQRPEKRVRWAGMWEFVHGGSDQAVNGDAVRSLVHRLTGLHVEPGPLLTTVRHGVTRFRITLNCYLAECARGRVLSPFYQRFDWVRPGDLGRYPLSTPQRRIAQLLMKRDRASKISGNKKRSVKQ